MVVVSTVGLGLSGCDPIVDPSAPVALTGGSDGLQLIFCESVEADRFAVEVRPAPNEPWQEVASGRELDLMAGETIDLSIYATEEAGSADNLPAGALVNLYVRISRPATAVDIAAEFVVPEGGIPTSSWVKPDGSVTDSPCAD